MRLSDPALQAKTRNDTQAQSIKKALEQASRNVKILADAGAPIAMGTDSGAGDGRWQGYFEHVELELMVKAGLTPMQALVAATRGAARVMKLDEQLGTLEPGTRADLVVLRAQPAQRHQEHASARCGVDRGTGGGAMKRARWMVMVLAASLGRRFGTAAAQTDNGEWRSHSGDPGSTKYAPLDQINRTNVKNLRIAWRRPAVDPLLSGKDPKLQVPNNFRATPLMIGGVLYSPERRRPGRGV